MLRDPEGDERFRVEGNAVWADLSMPGESSPPTVERWILHARWSAEGMTDSPEWGSTTAGRRDSCPGAFEHGSETQKMAGESRKSLLTALMGRPTIEMPLSRRNIMAYQVEKTPPKKGTQRPILPPEHHARPNRAALASAGYERGAAALRPTPSQTRAPQDTSAIVPGTSNAQIAGDEKARQDLPPEVAQTLKKKGYLVYPVNSLNVLNAQAKSDADKPIQQQKVGTGGYRLVTSGTFYYPDQGKQVPAGAVMRDGQLDTPGVPKAAERGGVAVLKDGSIVVGRMTGSNAADIQKRFGQTDNPVQDFLGGGALLVENGKTVTSKDLKEKQKFDQGGGGIEAQQMRKTDHVVVGIRDGRCFVIVAKNKTGKEIQADLSAAGFGTVVKYDGGSGGYAKDASGVKASGLNPTGLGVK